MFTYRDLVEMAHAEFLRKVDRAHELNARTFASVTRVLEENTGEGSPSPAEVVTRSLAVSRGLLETRNAYVRGLAKLLLN
jgi:hypothetical protein